MASLACGSLLGVDDFSLEASRQDGGAPPAPLDRHVEPPFTGDGCGPCMATDCEAESAACATDDCRKLLAPSPDPNVIHRRDLSFGADRWNDLHQGSEPTNAAYNYLRCAQSRCPVECNVGLDFECAGRFSWQAPFPEAIRLQVTNGIGGAAPDPALQLSLCLDSDTTCASPAGVARTDSAGFATLAADAKPPNVSAFDGHLLALDPGETYRDYVGVSSRPYAEGEFTSFYPFDSVTVDRWLELLKVSIGPGKSMVQVLPFDCQGLWAKTVVVELWTLDGTEPRRCSDCTVAYESDDGFAPDLLLPGLDSKGAQAYIANVPAGRRVAVVLRRRPRAGAPGGEIVAVHPLSLLPGTWHSVRLHPYPSARKHLADAIAASPG